MQRGRRYNISRNFKSYWKCHFAIQLFMPNIIITKNQAMKWPLNEDLGQNLKENIIFIKNFAGCLAGWRWIGERWIGWRWTGGRWIAEHWTGWWWIDERLIGWPWIWRCGCGCGCRTCGCCAGGSWSGSHWIGEYWISCPLTLPWLSYFLVLTFYDFHITL